MTGGGREEKAHADHVRKDNTTFILQMCSTPSVSIAMSFEPSWLQLRYDVLCLFSRTMLHVTQSNVQYTAKLASF